MIFQQTALDFSNVDQKRIKESRGHALDKTKRRVIQRSREHIDVIVLNRSSGVGGKEVAVMNNLAS